ncbi:hypothetical protein AB0D94_19445 [Streptomyces sp. NPDC048255]|uniref:hypothetical protein n=1 Tax=Streptomyces sp. NPDC048255 TaxID=3154713 RepID=UPI0033E4C9D7
MRTSIECGLCGSEGFEWAEFQVWAGECYCVGCLIPIGVLDGDVHDRMFPGAGASWWRLTFPDSRFPPDGPAEFSRCPAGHMVFQAAVALTLSEDGLVRGLSAGLRCPEDGGLHLFIDNAQVTLLGI